MVSEYAYPVLGGVPEHVHFLSRELVGMGHEVTVVTSWAPTGLKRRAREIDARNLAESGYRTVRVGISMPLVQNGSVARVTIGPGVKARLRAAVRGMDVVHVQGMAPPTLCLFALRASRAPVNVGTFHTYLEGGHWGYRTFFAYVRSAMNRTDRKIAVSRATVTSLSPYFSEDFEVIPNGIDCGLYRPLGPDERPRPGPPRILFMGRFDPRNGLGTLLDAAHRLAEEGREFTVQVVGDGPARPVYERQARRLGVWDRVEWHGLLNEGRADLYRHATVFAAPCTIASFGVVLLEAWASGVAVVCADNMGFREVMREGAPARVVPPGDGAALAAALGQVLDDEGLRRDWGRRGREVAVARFSWPQVARRIEALYREILRSKGPRPDLPPPAGLGLNLRRNPLELARNAPAALRLGRDLEAGRVPRTD